MREAMMHAEVGDDVFGDDPTVRRLEFLAAEWMGKEAAVFVPTGTMGNLAAFLAHCGRGHEVILGDQSHSYLLEAGGMAALGGIHPRPIPNQPDGTLRLEDIEAAIRNSADEHQPITRLVCLENTHNRCGGAALTVEYTHAVGVIAKRHGLRFHIDGARIFNAAVALGVPARELAAPADSITFCLSKGLCAPAGSLLCGDAAFIRLARRARKMLGGGMRQSGILAAAGIVALNTMVDRLKNDHAAAVAFANGLRSLPGLILEPDTPQTNMVYFNGAESVHLDAPAIAARLKERGVLVDVKGARRFRAVLHYWITPTDIDAVLGVLADILVRA
ncbi:MAG: low-specificity L-threonine aldolase [Chloroflexi bacterium]|nr:low-specificity L-threonine aldolase [Chloroflexota bacterium]